MKYLFIIFLSLLNVNVTDVKVSVEKFDDFAKRRMTTPSQDTIYFINFWATWCKPCVAELPYIEEVNGKEIDGKPVKTIMVSLDMLESLNSRVIPFLNKFNYNSEQVLLSDGSGNGFINKVDSSWSGAIPATVILKNGKQKFHEGMYRSAKHIEKEINKI